MTKSRIDTWSHRLILIQLSGVSLGLMWSMGVLLYAEYTHQRPIALLAGPTLVFLLISIISVIINLFLMVLTDES